METTSKPLVMQPVTTNTATTEISESQLFNQRRTLEEVPGAIFAGMTLAWIVASMLSLI